MLPGAITESSRHNQGQKTFKGSTRVSISGLTESYHATRWKWTNFILMLTETPAKDEFKALHLKRTHCNTVGVRWILQL